MSNFVVSPVSSDTQTHEGTLLLAIGFYKYVSKGHLKVSIEPLSIIWYTSVSVFFSKWEITNTSTWSKQ